MSRYQEAYKTIRARVRAGERKREIFDDFALGGEKEAWLAARILCQIPTNANRRRFRWVHVTLLVSFSLYALLDLLGFAICFFEGYLFEQFATGILSCLLVMIFTLFFSARWNPLGYLMADAIACYRLYRFFGDVVLPPAAILQCVFLGLTLLMGIVLQGGLFPNTSFFLWPKRDSLGIPKFED